MFFDLTNSKMTSKLSLKPTGIKLYANHIKIYHVVYIREKEKIWHYT